MTGHVKNDQRQSNAIIIVFTAVVLVFLMSACDGGGGGDGNGVNAESDVFSAACSPDFHPNLNITY
jgi:hypothetical protein